MISKIGEDFFKKDCEARDCYVRNNF